MAAITWPNVVAIAAELATVGVEAQQLILDHANVAFNPGMFGGESAPRLKMARIYLAAHMATMAKNAASGVAGPVISEEIGGLETRYAAPAASGRWSGTGYADLLNDLIRSSGARLPIVP